MRASFEEVAMQLAHTWALRSTCSARIRAGAVLVDQNNRVIAAGYNGSPRGFNHCDDVGCTFDGDGHCVSAIHAEENVILQCATTAVSTVGTIMYITHSPCYKCAMRMVQARIIGVYFGEVYGKALDDVRHMLSLRGIFLNKLDLSKR